MGEGRKRKMLEAGREWERGEGWTRVEATAAHSEALLWNWLPALRL